MWKDLKNSNKSTTYGLDSTIWPLKFGALRCKPAGQALVSNDVGFGELRCNADLHQLNCAAEEICKRCMEGADKRCFPCAWAAGKDHKSLCFQRCVELSDESDGEGQLGLIDHPRLKVSDEVGLGSCAQ